ncbi:MAG TPA: toll/interleukin-1 receptor domain-containing protein [Trebonia sp.]|jgi:hypothetical protein
MELFLSHASKDAQAVGMVRVQVEALGVQVYLAEHDNQAGDRLSAKVEQAISRCDAMLVLLTASGYDSRYVQQEIGFAKGRGKLIIPLLDPALTNADLGLLDDIEYILFDSGSPSDGLARLGERVDALARQNKATQEQALMLVAAVALIALLIYMDRG